MSAESKYLSNQVDDLRRAHKQAALHLVARRSVDNSHYQAMSAPNRHLTGAAARELDEHKQIDKALVSEARAVYDSVLSASAEHYAVNAEQYHELALQEAREAGIEVNFQGDVATNVHVRHSA